MRRLQAVTAVAAIALVSACAPALAHTSAGGTVGTVTGTLQIEGGPISPNGQQPGKRPTPGTVQFTGAGHSRVTVRVGDSGAFSVQLPPGSYVGCSRLAGEPVPCSLARRVTVTAGHTTEITFTFPVP